MNLNSKSELELRELQLTGSTNFGSLDNITDMGLITVIRTIMTSMMTSAELILTMKRLLMVCMSDHTLASLSPAMPHANAGENKEVPAREKISKENLSLTKNHTKSHQRAKTTTLSRLNLKPTWKKITPRSV